jgi:hypothetical protein
MKNLDKIKEKRSEYQSEYRTKNSDKFKEQKREYHKKNLSRKVNIALRIWLKLMNRKENIA